MPIEDSNNIEEQINYNSLKLLKRKYNKYLDDNLLEKKPLKKKIIIKEIIQIGSNFDLWNYEFISKDKSNNNPKNSGNEKKDLLSVFKIKGVLRNFSDLYSEVEELTPTLTDEEKLFEYLQAIKENDNKIISFNSSLLFSDGTQMRQYWKTNKDKIYKMITEEENQFIVQYKEQCEVLIKEYNNYQEKLEIKITEEEKLLEYLQAIKDNGNKILLQRCSLLFSDGTQMGTYWNANKDKIYKIITEEGNTFIVQYKDQCEVLIKEYNKKQLSVEEKLFEYLQAMKENGNKIIRQRDKNKTFSNNEKMGTYWSANNNKDKIYKMIIEEGNPFIVQYKDQCEVLIKEYNNYQEKQETKITEKEKLLEYLQIMKENDNKMIPQSSSLLFSDGIKMNQYWKNNKDKIYKMITEEGNPFVAQYKEQCEELIKEYNKKQLSEEEKLLEYLKAMKANGNKIVSGSSSLLFSDGTKMGIYWNGNKDKVYKMITEEGNQFIAQYKEQCEVLIKEYNNYQEKSETKITEKEKLFEYLQAMKDNDDEIITKSSSLLFSDGTKTGYYWNTNKDKIYKMITEESNQFIVKYKDQCEVLIKEYNKKQLSEEEKLFEYLQAMKENGNRIITQSSSLLFSDGTKMNQCWYHNKDKINKMITEEGNPFIVQYKVQCEELIKEYNKKPLNDVEKLLEYLQAIKANGNKIVSGSSPLLFSNGTKMGIYWNKTKNKIYKMITEEGNLFIVQYKDQCEVLINKYIEFQEKRENNKKIYNKMEEEFREESSFDKTIKNEKGKKSNEGKKVL